MNSSRSRALRHSMKRTSLSTNRNMSFSISHSGNHSRSNNLNTLPSLEERRSGQHWRTVSRLRSRELWQILGAADSPHEPGRLTSAPDRPDTGRSMAHVGNHSTRPRPGV